MSIVGRAISILIPLSAASFLLGGLTMDFGMTHTGDALNGIGLGCLILIGLSVAAISDDKPESTPEDKTAA